MNLVPRMTVTLLLFIAACKDKQSNKNQPTGATPGGSAPAAAPASSAAPTVPTGSTGTPRAGAAPAFGCFAWSATAKAAACVAGVRMSGDTRYTLHYLDGKTHEVTLPDPIDDKTAAAVNATLASAGYQPISGDVKPLTAGAPLAVGKDATLSFTATQTDPGGDNQPPTMKHEVSATCAGNTTPVHENEHEGGTAKVTVRMIGGHAVIEIATHIGREGESGDILEAAVVDMATCAVIRTPA